MIERLCRACGKPFQVPYPSSKRKNCSYKCRGVKTKTRADKGVRKSEWISLECPNCGSAFERPQHEVKAKRAKGWRLYCSPQCKDAQAAATWRGRPHKNTQGFTLKDGYKRIYVRKEDRDGGPAYQLEHRMVMAQKLGRALGPHETVHHVNGDKTDNRPENLQLRNGRHGKGRVLRCRACGSNDIEHVELE